MLYVQIRIEIPRNRVSEALEAYARMAYPREKKHLDEVGAKMVGCWSTQYGRQGEITFLFAYPDVAARERLMELSQQDTELSRWLTEVWQAEYASFATTKVLRPAPFSPLP